MTRCWLLRSRDFKAAHCGRSLRSPHWAFAVRRCPPLRPSPASLSTPQPAKKLRECTSKSLAEKSIRVEDAALPRGTTLTVSDLFFNTPARRKFLRAESTELAHVTALVTHYALAHPEKHFELVSASHTIVSAPPVARTAERIYQIFGKETLGQLLPLAAEAPFGACGVAGTAAVERRSR